MLHTKQGAALPGSWPARLYRFVLPALLALLACALPAHAQRALLTHADAPATLIRKTTLFDAPAGTTLNPGDVIGTGTGAAQFELAGGVLVALGPDSRVLLGNAGAAPLLTLLRGWVKVQATGAASGLSLNAGTLGVVVPGGGSSILHADAGQAEVFAETGTLALAATDKAPPGPPFTLGYEQYLVYRPSQKLAAGRAPRAFVTAMPRGFFDRMVAVAARVKPAQPVARREVQATDIALWNDAPAPLRKTLAARFAPRLSDPAFRAEAVALLGAQPEWREALQDGVAPRKKTRTVLNYLF
jgi:hypothetical protein